MQNRVRVRNTGLKSGIELWLGFNSAALYISVYRIAYSALPAYSNITHFQLNQKHMFFFCDFECQKTCALRFRNTCSYINSGRAILPIRIFVVECALFSVTSENITIAENYILWTIILCRKQSE